MKPWKVILATFVIFAAGLVTGAVWIKKTTRKTIPVETFLKGPPYIQKYYLERLRKTLDLTPEQVAKLDKTFADSRERIRILIDIIGPELNDELVAVHQAIENELSSDQKKKFEELLKRFRPGHNRSWERNRPRNRPDGKDQNTIRRRDVVPGTVPETRRRDTTEQSPPPLPALQKQP